MVDSEAASSILRMQSVTREPTVVVGEGGAIEVDGEGTRLVTESSIVNDNRKPGLSKMELEKHLQALLGVSKVIWFSGIIADAHVDGLARFIAPGKVLLSRPHPSSDKYLFETYQNAKETLAKSTDALGRKFQVLEVEEADGRLFAGADPYELCLSYVNYLLVNDGVVIPAFGDQVADQRALAQIQLVFPERKIRQSVTDSSLETRRWYSLHNTATAAMRRNLSLVCLVSYLYVR